MQLQVIRFGIRSTTNHFFAPLLDLMETMMQLQPS